MLRIKANDIIVKLAQSKDYNDCINKVQPANLREDLSHEVILILLETNADKILMMHEKNQLVFYAVRIIINLAFSKTSPFFKKYRGMHVYAELDNEPQVLELPDLSDKEIQIKERDENILALLDNVESYGDLIKGLDEYESQMLKMYAQYGSYRNMERELRIPYVSCFHTVKKAIKKLKQQI